MSNSLQPPAAPSLPGQPAPSVAPASSRPTLFELLLLLALVLLAAALRAYRLDAKSLGLEEILLATAAQAGASASLDTLAGPAYLWLMGPVSSASTAEWALRLPALITSTAGVAALWALGRRLFGPLAGLLASFMLALSSLHIELGQAALANALLATLSTLLLWSLYRAAEREAGGGAGQPVLRWLGAWISVVALAVLSLYTHRFAVVPVALSLAVFPLFLRAASPPGQPATRGALLHLIVAAAVIALAALPLLFAPAQPAAGPLGLPSPGALLLAFTTNRANWLFDPLFFTAVSLWWLAGLAWLLWRRRAIGVALALWMLLPLLAVPLLAQRAGGAAAPGQLLFILPIFLLTAALGMIALARLGALIAQALLPNYRRVANAAFALLLAASLAAFVKGSSDPVSFVYRKPAQDWRTLAAILDTQPGPRDQIVLLPGVAEPLRWYLRADARTVGTGLVDELTQLCQASAAVYVAEAAAPRQVSDDEARYLRENFVQAPLPDLLLHYRNCQPGQWYGAGAEALFSLAQRSDVDYPATARAREQFNALAAQAAAPAAPSPEPTSAQPLPVIAETPLPDVTPTPDAAPPAEPFAPPDAETLLAELLRIAPEEAMTQVRLGALAVQQGAPAEDAARHFQQAIELDPEAWLAYGLWANSLGSSGQITQALQVLDQGVQALPDSLALQTLQARWQDGPSAAGDEFQAALGAGRDALRERRWEGAIVAAQQAAALAPARHEAPLLLGDAYRGLGELAQALRAYQRAAELAPTLSFLHSRQAEMLARLGRIEEAAAASLLALAIDQGRWENWFALGRAYAAPALAAAAGLAGPADEARYVPAEPARAALLAEVLLLHAQSLAPPENEAPARALAELQAVLPGLTTGLGADATIEAGVDYAAMGAAQRNAARMEADEALQMGRPGDALAIYQALAEVDAEDRASRMGAANALAALGRNDEALAALEAISAQWSDFPFAHTRRGALLEELGQQEAALAAYREAVRVAPDNADTHFTLAYALRRAGQRGEAIAAFEAGLAIDPARDSARQALQALQAQP